MLQEATEEMCSHPPSANATIRILMSGSRVVFLISNSAIMECENRQR